MTVSEKLMASGEWSLALDPDTPRDLLDRIAPFSTVHIAAARVPLVGQSDGVLLGLMRWAGVVLRPGPQTVIGGQGLPLWLGSADGLVYRNTLGNFPDTPVGKTGKPLTEWADDILQGTELYRSSVCSTTNLMGGPFQWTATPRQVLDWVADATGTEWRVNANFTVDLETYTVIYDTSTHARITRRDGGREIVAPSIDGAFTVDIDAEDYTSTVVVLGSAGIGTAGGSSPYYMGASPLEVWRVVQDGQAAAGTEAATAAAVLSRYSALRRDVQLSSDLYDVRGELGCGALVDVWDPSTGLLDQTATPVRHRGEWITPVTLRCTSIDWPVRSGMGVYLRAFDAATTSLRWWDLTDYVVPEDGPTTIGLGANRRWSQL